MLWNFYAGDEALVGYRGNSSLTQLQDIGRSKAITQHLLKQEGPKGPRSLTWGKGQGSMW